MNQNTKNTGSTALGLAPDMLVEEHRGSLMTTLEGSGLSKAQCQLVTVIATTWARGLAREALMQGGSSGGRSTSSAKQAGASSESPQKRAARTRAANRSKPADLVKDVVAAATKSTSTRKPRASQGNAGGAPRTHTPQAEAGGTLAAA